MDLALPIATYICSLKPIKTQKFIFFYKMVTKTTSISSFYFWILHRQIDGKEHKYQQGITKGFEKFGFKI